jgi:hypothetical protein
VCSKSFRQLTSKFDQAASRESVKERCLSFVRSHAGALHDISYAINIQLMIVIVIFRNTFTELDEQHGAHTGKATLCCFFFLKNLLSYATSNTPRYVGDIFILCESFGFTSHQPLDNVRLFALFTTLRGIFRDPALPGRDKRWDDFYVLK